MNPRGARVAPRAVARRPKRHPRDVLHEKLLRRGTVEHYRDTELYDFEYEDRDKDVAWYRKLAEDRAPAEPILELGAGTGRITCPLANDGHTLLALDLHKAMLAALRKRVRRDELSSSITVIEADMRSLPLPDASVGMAIAPFNALMHLYTWPDLLGCFREVARVLVPGGTFAFDVEMPDLEWLTWDPSERHAVTPFTHPRTQEKLIYSTNHTYDPGSQVCHVRIFYDDAPPPGQRFVPPPVPRKLVHLAHRQVFPEEARLLVDTAGLTLVSHTGDFEGVSLGPSVQSQVIVCTKPSSSGA